MTDKQEHSPLPSRYAKYEGHTPGPWAHTFEAFDDHCFSRGEVTSPLGLIAILGAGDYGQWRDAPDNGDAEFEANAHLIADAPTLLAENKRLRKALEKAIAYIELVADDTDGEERAEARQDIAIARAALQGDSQ